ncbi:MAG: hypothetical protein KBF21_03705 [Thermoanaerobaculia bacterium]|jgi:hypothetical protein|nr:hypothetical protein [Thermoanaerobaculia bacterium]MBP9823310.1 hypothetical protein [Thermoanaerobaculia bacterium]
MRHLLLLPIVLSALTLGAHLLRGGLLPLALVAVALPLLLMPRSDTALRMLQGLLLLGAVEWLRTLLVILEQRRSLGQPWHRLVVILGAVALVTAFSALAAGLWQSRRAVGRRSGIPAEAA